MNAREYIRRLSERIVHAQKPIRILKALNWSPQVHERFFRAGARELPRPTYAPLDFDAKDKIREFQAIRASLRGRNALEGLLRRRCDEFINVVRMLESRGTKRFFTYSVRVYGQPRTVFLDSGVDNLQIARLWADRALRPGIDVEPRTLNADQAAQIIENLIKPVLGDACRVRVSARLTADAAAGATSVAVRKDARFSHRQARALAHHEGLWHVLTSLNGYAQPVLTVLGVGLSGFATAQEGGGVVSEYLSGNLAADRLRELGERALVVDMAAEGADYIEVYRYLCHRFPERKASQLAERVFRGGVVKGGAPFTKDAIYQRGYCRVFNFIRHAVEQAELPMLLAFFCGKMSLEDAPLVAALMDEGLVSPPRYIPPWAENLDGLAGHVMHSLTMGRFDLGKVSRYYDDVSATHASGLEGWADVFEGRRVEELEAVASADLPPSRPARRPASRPRTKRPPR